MTTVNLTINGRALNADVEPRTSLADLLRETHFLTGTHIGCEHGVCGACTILVDGVPTRSCITFAVTCELAEIITIEGLDNDEISTELRSTFAREHGLQCGYCTPGMIVSARDVVMRMEAPSERDVRVAMSGNLCRCTGYVGSVRAIQSVIADRRRRGIAAIPSGGRNRLGPAGSGNAAATAAAVAARSVAAVLDKDKPRSSQKAEAAWVDARWKPQTSFQQSFVVANSVEEVWEFFGRIGDVVKCLPGAALDREPENGHVEGRIRIKLGPITAEFRGAADVTRDDTTRSGTITGSGRDARSNSATRGAIRYVVKPDQEGGKSRVDVDVGFTLTGVLAQFSRSAIVQDVANRLTDVFVQNLEARLHAARGGRANPPTAAAVQELNVGSLIWSIVIDRLNGIVARLFNRR
jgi:carbon-monoxide dehydrogenase small subunit